MITTGIIKKINVSGGKHKNNKVIAEVSLFKSPGDINSDVYSCECNCSVPGGIYSPYNVGDKVVINVKDFRKITTLDTIYGIMYIYKFTDEDRNVYIWKTGKVVSSDISSIKGTVKSCSEYNREKQTELTRCKTF